MPNDSTTFTANLVQRLATSATGYAVVNNGVLDVRTVTDNKGSSAGVALGIAGHITLCRDPDCDCREQILAKELPSARLVAVKIEVIHAAL